MLRALLLSFFLLISTAAPARGEALTATPENADIENLRLTLTLALKSAELGHKPFEALLFGPDGKMLLQGVGRSTAECVRHAGLSLAGDICLRVDKKTLAASTVYLSAEPCPMCAEALFLAGVRRVVYGLGRDRLFQIADPEGKLPRTFIPAREVFERSNRPVAILGPLLEDEAEKPLRAYLKQARNDSTIIGRLAE